MQELRQEQRKHLFCAVLAPKKKVALKVPLSQIKIKLADKTMT
jgi:hypothetical protein